MKDIKKVRTEIRLAPELKERLKCERRKTGKTETAIIEEALCRYFDIVEKEQFIEMLLEKYDERYKDMLVGIKLASVAADRNIQALMSIKNTELFFNGYRPDSYMSVYETRHSVMSASVADVKKQIGRQKQNKDNKRV